MDRQHQRREKSKGVIDPVKATQKRITHYELLSALIGALAAVVLSPLSLTISHFLNERFSQAILSIEYAECVKEDIRIKVPSESLAALIRSDGFRRRLTMHSRDAAQVEEATIEGKELSQGECRSVKKSLESLETEIDSRNDELAGIRKAASDAKSEAELDAAFARYIGVPTEFAPAKSDLEAGIAELCAKVDAEVASATETRNAATALSEVLDKKAKGALGQLRFKLSILNRGSTDGLARNRGEVTFDGFHLTLPVVRTSEKKASSPYFAMAVPVAVVDSTDSFDNNRSVGKVEKNSMSEFWFQVDVDGLSKDLRARFAQILAAGKLGKCKVVIYDQNRRRIEFTWAD